MGLICNDILECKVFFMCSTARMCIAYVNTSLLFLNKVLWLAVTDYCITAYFLYYNSNFDFIHL